MTTVKAYAKINLTLDIVAKRSDGYHEVEMIMQSVSLHDIITLEPNNSGEITLSCTKDNVPTDKRNIAYKAAELYYDKIAKPCEGLHITIEKSIPVEAGLAGGSADAAAVLVGLNSMHGNALSIEQLCKVGKNIGADVPFCIVGSTMLATGTGTSLSKLPDMPSCSIVIAKPSFSVSTPQAYKSFDACEPKDMTMYNKAAVNALEKQDFVALCDNMFNAFERVISHESINSIKAVMTECGAVKAQMSGSGPSVFGVFDNAQNAVKAADALNAAMIPAFVCSPCKYGCEIVG